MDVETISAAPRTAVSCDIDCRQHRLIQDKPPASGGEDQGPMASEFLSAALLACQLSTFAKVAAKRKAEATVRSVRADMAFNDAGDIDHIEVVWDIDAAPEVNIETLLKLTDKVCTISRALSVPVHHSR